MNKYETIMILNPDLTEEECGKVQNIKIKRIDTIMMLKQLALLKL